MRRNKICCYFETATFLTKYIEAVNWVSLPTNIYCTPLFLYLPMSFLIIGQRTWKETKNNKHHQNFSMMWNYSVSCIWDVFSLEQLCIQTKIITVLFVLLLLCIIWYGNQEKDMGLNCLYDINDESRNVLVQNLVLGRPSRSNSGIVFFRF